MRLNIRSTYLKCRKITTEPRSSVFDPKASSVRPVGPGGSGDKI